jgi:hypothetical protein
MSSEKQLPQFDAIVFLHKVPVEQSHPLVEEWLNLMSSVLFPSG